MRVYLPKGFGNNRTSDGSFGAPSLEVAFGLEHLRNVQVLEYLESRLHVASRMVHT